MNKDIRVLTTFPRHPKTIKLKRLIGTWEPIITLWLWCAENRPTGDLSCMEPEDIAIAANWEKDPKQLFEALLNVRFIENNGEKNGQVAYVLHGWKEHNAYAANAEKRSEKARLAAIARWEQKLNGCSSDANGCSEHASSNAPIPSPTPSPSPDPKRKEKTKTGVSVSLPEWFPSDLWETFLAHRKAIKAAITPRSYLGFIKKFDALRLQGFDPAFVIDTMVEKGWRWFKPEWIKTEDPVMQRLQGKYDKRTAATLKTMYDIMQKEEQNGIEAEEEIH